MYVRNINNKSNFLVTYVSYVLTCKSLCVQFSRIIYLTYKDKIRNQLKDIVQVIFVENIFIFFYKL